jgi:hypothetical protein
MRFFQVTSKTRLAVSDASECEEAILEVARQQGTVLQVFERLSSGVQYPLNSLDDIITTSQEECEQVDMCLKRHLIETRSRCPLYRSEPFQVSHGAD